MPELLRSLHIAAGERHGQGELKLFELMLALAFGFGGAMASGGSSWPTALIDATVGDRSSSAAGG